MKKIVAAVIVVLLLVTGPWWMGGIARSRIDHAFESVPKNAPYLKIVENKWTHGWLHSEQLITFELVLPPQIRASLPVVARVAYAPAAGAQPTAQEIPNAPPTLPQLPPIRFSLRGEMLHGPILGDAGFGLARLESKVVISEDIRKKMIELLGTDDPVQVVTRMEFFGGTSTSVSGKGRSIALGKLDPKQEGGTLAWDDFKLSIGIARHADSYDVDGRQPRIEVRSKDGDHALLSDITLKGSGKRIFGDLYEGGATFGLGKLGVTSSGKQTVEIAALEYGFDASKKGDFLDYAMKVGSGAVQSKDLEAAGLQLQQVHFDFGMRHLHIETLQKLMDGLRAADAKVFQGTGDAQSALVEPLKQNGMALIKHDPELALDRVGIVTAQGAGVLKGSIKLEGVTDADLAAGAMALLPKLVADFTVEIAQALLDKIPNGATLAGTGVDQGYLKREGDKLVSHIEYRHGEVMVNGKAPEMPKNLQLPGMTPAPPPAPPTPPTPPTPRTPRKPGK